MMKNSNIAIRNWVRRNTEMITNDMLMSIINRGASDWVEITKRDDIHIMPKANAWRFKEDSENLWVSQYAYELSYLGFIVCCSDLGNYLVLNNGVNSDYLWEQVRTMLRKYFKSKFVM